LTVQGAHRTERADPLPSHYYNNLPEIPAVWDRTEADAEHVKYQKKAKGICAGQRMLRDRITRENEARCAPCQGANRCTNQQRSSTGIDRACRPLRWFRAACGRKRDAT